MSYLIYFCLTLHFLVILLCLVCFLVGVVFWRKARKASPYWKFFTLGFLFIWLAELADIFAPVYEQQFGGINFYTEATQGVGAALLFLGIIGFLRKKVEKRGQEKEYEKKAGE